MYRGACGVNHSALPMRTAPGAYTSSARTSVQSVATEMKRTTRTLDRYCVPISAATRENREEEEDSNVLLVRSRR